MSAISRGSQKPYTTPMASRVASRIGGQHFHRSVRAACRVHAAQLPSSDLVPPVLIMDIGHGTLEVTIGEEVGVLYFPKVKETKAEKRRSSAPAHRRS